MDITVSSEEFPVAAAAIHDVRVELSFELGSCFLKNAREVIKPVKGVAKGGEVEAVDLMGAELAILNGEQIVSANSCDEKGCGLARESFVSEVFYEVKELAWLIADGLQEAEVFLTVVGEVVAVACLILLKALSE